MEYFLALCNHKHDFKHNGQGCVHLVLVQGIESRAPSKKINSCLMSVRMAKWSKASDSS